MRRFDWNGTLAIKYRGHDLSVVARGNYDPGQAYGDPYHCYPPESEVDIIEVNEVCHGRTRKLSVESMNKLAEREDFIEAVMNTAIEEMDNRRQDHAEAIMDERRERGYSHGNN